MNKVKWICKNGVQISEWTSFPYAFREMYRIVNKYIASGKPLDTIKNGFQIVGPPNVKGEPMIYNYTKANSLATSMGLLLPDGTLNQKEFKRR